MIHTRKWSHGSLIALVGLVACADVRADEYRGSWIDAWHAGFLSQAQVDALLGVPGNAGSKGTIRNSNLNAVFVQVRRRADVAYPSGVGEPYMSGLSPSTFNALAAIIKAAHDTTGGKQRIEVHCWMVVFKTGKGQVYSQHSDTANPDNYWPTRISSTTGAENTDGAFDPGHPKVLQYLVNVGMDLVNFHTTAGVDGTDGDIDGIHYDYIRFEATSEGYNPTSVARYNTRYGLTGDPASSSSQFKQWRRDQITAYVRQMYARIQATKPWVKQSGAFVTWNPSPTASTRAAFQATSPYAVYSDWDSWLQEGIVDMAVPMTYYDYDTYPNDYVRWMNFEKDRHGNRHMVIGPGTYLNTLSNAILELQMTRDASPAGNYADGYSEYDYYTPYDGGTWAGFQPTLVAQVNPTAANTPSMPWKTSPTTGHISGTVTAVPGNAWADHAQVSITGPVNRGPMYVDGTGFYAFIDLPPGTYTVTASKTGYPSATASVTVAVGQVTGNMYIQNLVLGNTTPTIGNVQATSITNNSANITWTTDLASTSQVEYGATPSYGSTSALDSTPVTSHSVTLTGLAPNTLYYYRVISSNANGTSYSDPGAFTSSGVPTISNVQALSIGTTTATITWSTNAPATSRVNYGLTAGYGSQSPLDPVLVTSHSVMLSGLQSNTTYHYQVLSTNAYGAAQSGDATFTTAASISDVIVDNTDATPAFQYVLGSSWTTGTASSHYRSNYFYCYEVSGTDEASATHRARWTPTLPAGGNWDVYVWYASGTNRTTNSFWKIVNAGPAITQRVNQEQGGNGWTLLASDVPFNAGTAGYVEMGNNTGLTGTSQVVQGDAVKFVYKGSVGDTQAPSVPSGVTSSAASSGSVQLNWTASTDNVGVSGYRIYRDGVCVASSTTNSYLDTGLIANTAYSYEVSAYDAAGNESARSFPAAVRVTLSVPPTAATVSCNRESGVWYGTGTFTFTAADGFGPGAISSYKYAWDNSATHAWSGSEPDWSSGTLPRTAASSGNWYLHVKGYNSENAANGTLDLGPYRYDPTGPSSPVVTDDGTYTATPTSLHATWTAAADGESGIARYEYRVIQQGGGVARDWTEVAAATEVTATGLSLLFGKTYVFEVHAVNNAGIAGTAGTSDGIVIFTIDVNENGTVNSIDFDAFFECCAGPGQPYPTGGSVDCSRFDLNADDDVDQDDFGRFQRCMTGTMPVDLTCAN